MIMLVLAVFGASLLGSLHCVGMCGAFLTLVAEGRSRHRMQMGYHAGRLVTYASLGAVAGMLGRGIDVASTLAGIQPMATLLSASAITLVAVMTWMRLKGWKAPHVPMPAWTQRVALAGYGVAMSRPPVQRGLIIGLLTTLLPCGWLWTFLVTSAGTGSPTRAAMTMVFFWLGTLPAMVALGTGIGTVFGAAQRHLPTISCALMLAVGLLTVSGRAALNPASWSQPHPAHASAGTPVRPPCCEVEDALDH